MENVDTLIRRVTFEELKAGAEYKKKLLGRAFPNSDPFSDLNGIALFLDVNKKPLYFMVRENTFTIESTFKEDPSWFINTYGGVKLPKLKYDRDVVLKQMEKAEQKLKLAGGELNDDELHELWNYVGRGINEPFATYHKRHCRWTDYLETKMIVDGGKMILCVIYP